jgi:hypothetical protein
MSDKPSEPGTPPDPANDASPGPSPGDQAIRAAIQNSIGERRAAPRVIVEEPCIVHYGPHVVSGVLRDVSAGGAMLRGVSGLIAGDSVALVVPRLGTRRFIVVVRAMTLLGAHLGLADQDEAGAWRRALSPLLGEAGEHPPA